MAAFKKSIGPDSELYGDNSTVITYCITMASILYLYNMFLSDSTSFLCLSVIVQTLLELTDLFVSILILDVFIVLSLYFKLSQRKMFKLIYKLLESY